jgi:hypothetical protein
MDKLNQMFPHDSQPSGSSSSGISGGLGRSGSGLKGIKSAKTPTPKIKLTPAKTPTMHQMMTGMSKSPKMPKMPRIKGTLHLKDGGHVPVKLSDGEFPVYPHHVNNIGNGDAETGHRALNNWIMHIRHHNIQRLAALPKPVA